MPSIYDNLNKWGVPEEWDRGGENWSDAWGTTHALWFGTILKRIAAWLPAEHLLELAPGYGRVTQYLIRHCDRYSGIELAPICVEACKRRFAGEAHATFHVGDGRSLTMIEDASIGFAFSWDSLVHADRSVLEGYVTELAAKLVPGACAFLHHSNLGAFVDANGALTVENPHWRDVSTSAAIVRDVCRNAGVECVSQELIQWGLDHHSDCLTVLRRPASGEAVDLETEPRQFENPHMNEEIGYSRILDGLYRGEKSENVES